MSSTIRRGGKKGKIIQITHMAYNRPLNLIVFDPNTVSEAGWKN
jgi:hypothetical protein